MISERNLLLKIESWMPSNLEREKGASSKVLKLTITKNYTRCITIYIVICLFTHFVALLIISRNSNSFPFNDILIKTLHNSILNNCCSIVLTVDISEKFRPRSNSKNNGYFYLHFNTINFGIKFAFLLVLKLFGVYKT